MLVQKAYNKLRVPLMIYKNKNNILNYTKNEIKFRQCPSNWVDKRRIVSGISELQASFVNCKHINGDQKPLKNGV